jgi:sirohydrochlorin cobaltochelatase
MNIRQMRVAIAAVVGLTTIANVGVSTQTKDVGIVLLAHGGSAAWNATVDDLRARVNDRVPTEVAFGMATRATIQAAIDRLSERGVREIVGVPLFISSHSSVVDSTRYLLGARAQAPADLALFARMSHGAPAAAATGAHAEHGEKAPAEDGTRPVRSSVPVRVTGALDDHPIVADILLSRAKAISRDPAHEAVLIVAHGLNGFDYAMALQGIMPDDRLVQWVLDAANAGR